VIRCELRNHHPSPEEPAFMHPAQRACLHQQRIRSHATSSDSYAFFNLLADSEFLNPVELLLPAHRERLFPPTGTLSMFLAQAMSADRSCQEAVDDVTIKRLVGAGCHCVVPIQVHTAGHGRVAIGTGLYTDPPHRLCDGRKHPGNMALAGSPGEAGGWCDRGIA